MLLQRAIVNVGETMALAVLPDREHGADCTQCVVRSDEIVM
jgi:hypothetical protein